MASLTNALIDATTEKVRVVYMNRGIAKVWNSSKSRRGDEPAVFCGYYWINGREEGGPFKTYSAALRDAWYRKVMGVEPPVIGERVFRNNAR
jgi:hypothetical protein